jgi:hypothetical protein
MGVILTRYGDDTMAGGKKTKKYNFPRKKFKLAPWMREVISKYKESSGSTIEEIARRIKISKGQLQRPLYGYSNCSRDSYMRISNFAERIRRGNQR